jgi:hypothetical protein
MQKEKEKEKGEEGFKKSVGRCYSPQMKATTSFFGLSVTYLLAYHLLADCFLSLSLRVENGRWNEDG